ncbi:hypothetical protein [Amnibacterium kyonggiense]
MSHPSNRAARPLGLVVVAVIEALEAVALLVLAVRAVAAGVDSPYPLTTYGVAGTLLIAAALLALVAVGTWRARPWSRTSGLVWQLVQLLVGAYATQGPGAPIGFAVLAMVPAAVAAVLLLTRPVREATARSTGRA